MCNLLTAPLVPVAFSARPEPGMLTLPQIFSRIAGDAIDDFPGLAAHQAQAWRYAGCPNGSFPLPNS